MGTVTTGVVFVHGIGDQAPCGTLRDWSRVIVSALTRCRTGGDGAAPPADPVVASQLDETGESFSFIELAVGGDEGGDERRWLITEAWWAHLTQPPTVAAMTAYVRTAIKPIADGIAKGYRDREQSWPQWVADVRAHASEPGYPYRDVVLSQVPQAGRGWIESLDWIQMHLTWLVLYPICGLVWLVMLLYAPIRRLPIDAIQNSSALASFDGFLTGWFGGLPSITRDAAQSAAVRQRLADAIRALRDRGCERVVVVAHSGGAVVTFETLADPAYADLPVDKVVTFGEGLDLAWRIEAGSAASPAPLQGDLSARAGLGWVNFWSTYDPAPAGPMEQPAGVKHFDHADQATVNRMSVLDDHGSYWDNDEEFVRPLLQHLDAPAAPIESSRFFEDPGLAAVRAVWRRQRVAILAVWRWVATLEAALPIVLTTVAALLGIATLHGPNKLGDDVARWWATIPGHETTSTPLDALLAAPSWPPLLRQAGEWCLGVVLVVLGFLLLARLGIALWSRWDVRERESAFAATPVRPSRRVPFAELALLSLLGAVASLGLIAYLSQ